MSQVETVFLSEYMGDDNGKTAKVNQYGRWFIAELYKDGELIKRDSQLNEDDAEGIAEEWVHNDTI
jgi:hypothetical protein